MTYLESGQYSSILKNHSILFKIPLRISEFQFMGLLEAGFAIWTMDDFIRSNTGSGESYKALQALSGSNLAITTERQREREREEEITFLSL